MTLEDQHIDRKSLRSVIGNNADWDQIAKDCVCFANGNGGRLLIGVEDGECEPPAGQTVQPGLLEKLRKRIGELTVNVQVLPTIQRVDNGGEYLELIIDRSASVASTCDGRYYLRVGDNCQPVLGDDVLRLANERPGRPWEAMDSRVPRGLLDNGKLTAFVMAIRGSVAILVEADLLCDRAAVMANQRYRMSFVQGLLASFLSGVAARSHRALFGAAMATDVRQRQHEMLQLQERLGVVRRAEGHHGSGAPSRD